MTAPGEPTGPVEREASIDEEKAVIRHAILAGPARALGLFKRVPEVFKKRGWSLDDDLVAVAISAISIKRMEEVISPEAVAFGWEGRQHGTNAKIYLRRPPAADTCGDRWPNTVPRATPREVVSLLDLDELLMPV
jgi:hypothetical protein